MEPGQLVNNIGEEIARQGAFGVLFAIPIGMVMAFIYVSTGLRGALELGGRVLKAVRRTIEQPRKGGRTLGAAMTGTVASYAILSSAYSDLEESINNQAWTTLEGSLGTAIVVAGKSVGGLAIGMMLANTLNEQKESTEENSVS